MIYQVGDLLDLATWRRVDDKNLGRQGDDEFISLTSGFDRRAAGQSLER